MEKKTNKYHLTLAYKGNGDEETSGEKYLELDFENHDELFGIIDKIKLLDPFSNEQQSIEFAIGLKMFSEIMIKNRKHPLFEELYPAFGNFMKQLKSMNKD
jgi:hypothetical protein